MKRRLFAVVLLAGCVSSRVDAADEPTAQKTVREAIARSLTFLEQDSIKWRQEHGCATCHHVPFLLWTMNDARDRGFAVGEETFLETMRWVMSDKESLVTAGILRDPSTPPDTRPGRNGVSLASIYTALATRSMKLDANQRDAIARIEDHVVARQAADGSWESPPPSNGPPPVFESRETMTLWACLALQTSAPVEAERASAIRESILKGIEWLNQTPPGDTTQATALRLLLDIRRSQPATQVQAGREKLLARQNPDGGWGQINEAPSDAYATGQALYVLAEPGLDNETPEIRRAVSFLVASQHADGSWPMTPRAIPERPASTNTVPIVYFGSGWATLGLLRFAPK